MAVKPFPSVDDVKPLEEGGPIARNGFSYQDEIAVWFLIEMLIDDSILKVHCESHDDILLVRKIKGTEEKIAEFIQVKANQGKLWSIADVCGSKGKQLGKSVFETSLAHDRHEEKALFRLVTLENVNGDLKALTFAVGATGREAGGEQLVALAAQFDGYCADSKSPKGNTVNYWLENVFWDVRRDENGIRRDNLLRLLQLSSAEQRPLLPGQAESIADDLRRLAIDAAQAKWEPDKEKKIITRSSLLQWWNKRVEDTRGHVDAIGGGKLKDKMDAAGLSDDLIGLAIEMRRDYSAAIRTPRYMEATDGKRLQQAVKSEIASLRARYLANQITLDSVGFHSLCLERMDSLNSTLGFDQGVHTAFLKGCMYDIADRCLLRFTKS